MGQRVKRYAVSPCMGENLDFGNSNPADIIKALIIDDDVPSRGHRKNILHPGWAIKSNEISFILKLIRIEYQIVSKIKFTKC